VQLAELLAEDALLLINILFFVITEELQPYREAEVLAGGPTCSRP